MIRVLLALLLLTTFQAQAHEVRPAYLELREVADGQFQLLLKTPMRGTSRLSLAAEFSGGTRILGPVTTTHSDGAAIQTWMLEAIDPMPGQWLRIIGLESTMTDTLVHAEFLDGSTWTHRFTPSTPAAQIPARQSGLAVAGSYLSLGVEHILAGIDHLLFVLTLLFLASGLRMLIKTVTAFTLAHSITLGLAILGVVKMPQAPVEAVIALSIVFVAAEILRAKLGYVSLAARAPWVVAFLFGLVHGFGFAGALGEIGLPAAHIPLALLFFNLGVEAGQLIFIACVVSLVLLLKKIRVPREPFGGVTVVYSIGSVAMFWVIQRVAAF